jgi:predicted GTPase
VATLFALPVLVLVLAGTYALWDIGWLAWLAWLLPLGWGVAFLLLRYRPGRLDNKGWPTGDRPGLWTPRDEEIYDSVRRDQQAAPQISVSQLSDPHFYLQSALNLANDVARRYHPKASDPVSALTVVEVLAAAQLALEDSASWLHDNVPGSHLLTIRHWRALSHAPRWLQLVSDASWLVSVWWNPANLPRWVASKYTASSATQEVEASLLAAFHQEFLHNVLLHCIEMNSGRLRGGVARYRAALAGLQTRRGRHAASRPAPPKNAKGAEEPVAGSQTHEEQSASAPHAVRLAVVGQVNAGKSSLINAILGANRASCDVLAATDAVQHYRYALPQHDVQLELLDTPGYGSSELAKSQQEAIQGACAQADLVLLVMDVTSPARQADWRLVSDLNTWYESRPKLKPPPVLGVLTHIDGLSPAMEWSPPYDWQHPNRPKEHSLRAAVEYTEQVFADELIAVIPVCTDATPGRTFGVQQWLLPAVAAALPEAQASLVVRALHKEMDSERIRQLVRQLRGAGVQVLRMLLDTKG